MKRGLFGATTSLITSTVVTKLNVLTNVCINPDCFDLHIFKILTLWYLLVHIKISLFLCSLTILRCTIVPYLVLSAGQNRIDHLKCVNILSLNTIVNMINKLKCLTLITIYVICMVQIITLLAAVYMST